MIAILTLLLMLTSVGAQLAAQYTLTSYASLAYEWASDSVAMWQRLDRLTNAPDVLSKLNATAVGRPPLPIKAGQLVGNVRAQGFAFGALNDAHRIRYIKALVHHRRSQALYLDAGIVPAVNISQVRLLIPNYKEQIYDRTFHWQDGIDMQIESDQTSLVRRFCSSIFGTSLLFTISI
jgi:hypothetical protein